MARIGIYGGTFNPPHLGHTEAAREAIELLGLDRLLVIPAAVPPHKTLPHGSPTVQQRLSLVELAFSRVEGASVMDLELRRQGKSYTADTVEELRRLYPQDELILLMGTDMLLSFMTWYQPERICANCSLAWFRRDQEDEKHLAELVEKAELIRSTFGCQVHALENTALPMSSTDVRRLICFGGAEATLDPSVLAEIRTLGLYGAGDSCKELSPEALEAKVISLLDPKRVPHVLGCRDIAVRLAAHYGISTEDAARAGLLHDVTKALKPPMQKLLLEHYGISPEEYADETKHTLHAFTGSLIAKEVFGEKESIYKAIASHTTGCSHMTGLQKIIYMADYVEPCRDFPGVERLRAMAFRDLDFAMLMGIKITVDHVLGKGEALASSTQATLAWFTDLCKNKDYSQEGVTIS